MASKEDDEKLLAELKKARQEDKEAEPVKKAGKSKVVREAFDRKHGKGTKNGR